jgi:hypothetical protein
MRNYFKTFMYLFAFIWVSSAAGGAYEDFFRAVDNDDAATVVRLLDRGFDPNAPNEQGQVPLYVALRSQSPRVVGALLDRADLRVDATNHNGETPLMMAALRGQLEWAQRLLARGAAVNKEGWSPLHYAATGPEPKVVALLLERGAQIDAPSPNRTTPVMMAAQYGAEASVTLLLERGANAKLRNDKGFGVVDFARLGGREALAARLERLQQ